MDCLPVSGKHAGLSKSLRKSGVRVRGVGDSLHGVAVVHSCHSFCDHLAGVIAQNVDAEEFVCSRAGQYFHKSL